MTSSSEKPRGLTDLEAVTIAYILRRGPCTPYQVRSSFTKSITKRFSSSAGSIYPLMRRLHERGDLKLADTPSDGRGSRQYLTSKRGRLKVRRWIADLSDPAAIGIYDPIRTRLLNLSLLAAPDQLQWLEATIELVVQQQEVIRVYETQEFVGDNRLYEISRDAMWQENELRLGYLRRALAALKEDPDAS